MTRPEAPTQPLRILLSEDDAEMRSLLETTLRHEGYAVTPCADGEALLDRLGAALAAEEPGYGLVISDIRMPGLSGLEFLEWTSSWESHPPVILITAFGDRETHERAKQLGALGVLDKPFDTDELLALVRVVAAGGRPDLQ